jgi:hypothetical protein
MTTGGIIWGFIKGLLGEYNSIFINILVRFIGGSNRNTTIENLLQMQVANNFLLSAYHQVRESNS